MRLIICLDDKNGYSFANRRQSRDKIQLAKMLELVGDSTLLLNEYSAKLLENPPNNVKVTENFLKTAAEDDFCFVENLDISKHLSAVKQLIVYRWNRAYPYSDKLGPAMRRSIQRPIVCTLLQFHIHTSGDH